MQKTISKNPIFFTQRTVLRVNKIVNSAQREVNLEKVLKQLTRIIDPIIEKLLISYVDKKFRKIVTYSISTGGKRLRPALAIISCKMLGGKIEDVLHPAAGLEIIHNYSLIIDDIIDNSLMRRKKPTLWHRFGESMALCGAIDYSATILQSANRSKNSTLVAELFAKTIKKLVDGEILDILFEQSGRENEPFVCQSRYKKITMNDYFEMVKGKTGALLQASCLLGGICANAKEKELKALKNYGLNLGIAFQIRDDILDIFGEEKKFGKKIGKDIEERKGGNVVIILALEELSLKERENFLKILKKRKKTKKDIERAVKILQKTRAKEEAFKLGEKFIKKAKKSLGNLPQNQYNEILKKITDFVIKREK